MVYRVKLNSSSTNCNYLYLVCNSIRCNDSVLFKTINRKVLDTILGFSAGVMIAAAFWSLISPSIELSSELGYISWLLPAVGFIVGGLFVLISDKFLDKALKNKDSNGRLFM